MRKLTEGEKKLLSEHGAYMTMAPLILPILDEKERMAIASLVMDFKQGNTNLLPKVAELSVIIDLKEDIKLKCKQIELLESRR